MEWGKGGGGGRGIGIGLLDESFAHEPSRRFITLPAVQLELPLARPLGMQIQCHYIVWLFSDASSVNVLSDGMTPSDAEKAPSAYCAHRHSPTHKVTYTDAFSKGKHCNDE